MGVFGKWARDFGASELVGRQARDFGAGELVFGVFGKWDFGSSE